MTAPLIVPPADAPAPRRMPPTAGGTPPLVAAQICAQCGDHWGPDTRWRCSCFTGGTNG
jgi:hypothetical protein